MVLIPSQGITGYLVALLIGQLIITALDVFAVLRYVTFQMDAVNSIVKPGIIVAFAGNLLNACYEYMKKMTHINEVVFLLTFCFVLCVICLALLLITGAIKKHDFS